MCGAGLRYLLMKWLPFGFYNMMWINLVACVILGLLFRAKLGQTQQIFFIYGFFGSLSAFSSYIKDDVSLWKQGKIVGPIFYVIVSNLLGILSLGYFYPSA